MMNRVHRTLCSSRLWAKAVARELPQVLDPLPLGERVLEIGPGFGATTEVLAGRVPELTAVEVDQASARLLERKFAGRAEIVHGDGARLPFTDGRFSSVVCFTMLHHVPSVAAQDELFAQAFRVVEPGGVFAGVDSLANLGFRLLHLGDTMVVLDPQRLPMRLRAAGFTDVHVQHVPKRRVRFFARKPG
ncbi:methyltransferase domain-containing protein [Sciscionella marina]|uniref:methyltransferase domain-containing protein n=1 Tax=Sciscionella marina TaxID=508770 RepID=UPI00037891A9